MRALLQRRPWSVRTRVMVTLAVLTTAVLLAVAVAFNLLVRGYVHSRVSGQLDAIRSGIDLRPPRRGQEGIAPPKPGGTDGRGRRADGGLDRITGVRGSAVALDSEGALCAAPGGDSSPGEELSAYFSSGHELSEKIQRRAVSLESGNYLLSVVRDQDDPGIWWVCYVDVTAIQAFTRQVNLVLCGIILAAIILSVLCSRWIAGSFSAPVQSLSDFAGEIGRGDFQRREFRFQDREFLRLGESMNRMAEELQRANRKQEIFFQNVSHELRTPLTSIRGAAEGIVCGIMDPEASGQIILSEADRLGGLVEDLLYLSRLGKAAPEGEIAPLDLRDVLSLCVSEQRVEAERRGVAFSFDFDESPVLLAIRERDARQLCGNLLSNAIRYAVSSVAISCRRDGAGAIVAVADDGPGISPGDLPHIFQRFYHGEGGKHGIGLSIVQSVAESYHGTVTAENAGGAVFTVRFPAGAS